MPDPHKTWTADDLREYIREWIASRHHLTSHELAVMLAHAVESRPAAAGLLAEMFSEEIMAKFRQQKISES